MAGNQFVIYRADDGDIAHRLGEGQGDALEASLPEQGRGPSALPEPVLGHEYGQSGRQEVDGDPRYQLVAPERDRGDAMQA